VEYAAGQVALFTQLQAEQVNIQVLFGRGDGVA
jgi:hypothetical protein